MKSIGKWIGRVAAATLVMGPAGARSGPIVSNADLQAAGYGEYWSARVPLSGGDAVVSLLLMDENLYAGTRSGLWFAVHADTGLIRWAASAGDHVAVLHPPTHLRSDSGGGPVVLTSHGRVKVLDRYNGEPIREVELPLSASAPASCDGASMYFGAADSRFYSLRWYDDPRAGGLVRWRATLDGLVMSAPVLSGDGRVFFVTDQGSVYCVRGADKGLEWRSGGRGAVAGGLYVDESGAYVASTDHRLYVLDERTGDTIIRYLLPGPLFDTPVVVQRTAYQFCRGAGLFAFDADSRDALWNRDDLTRFVARAAERLVARDRRGDLVLLDNESGAVHGSLKLPIGALTAENARDTVLYLAMPDGRLLCAKPAGFPYLRREQVADARYRLHRRPPLDSPSTDSPDAAPPTADEESVTDPLRSGGRNP